jgi:nicotinamide riboside kinase
MAEAVVIAIVGAESTGKSRLAQGLAQRLAEETGLSGTWVPEFLREWCDREARTPRPEEQAAIAAEQHRRIDVAAANHAIVVCDTTAVMTAVYSQMLFGDASLRPFAVAQQRRCSHTLLTALDIPWQADGLQRDGPQVRAPVDALVRGLLIENGLPFSVVAGLGDARLEAALDAVVPLFSQRSAPRSGLLTRLQQRDASQPAWRWVCDSCDAPDCEHAALRAARASLLQRP